MHEPTTLNLSKLLLTGISVCIFFCSCLSGCYELSAPTPPTPLNPSTGPPLPSTTILPDGIDSAIAARLTKRLESDHFIFHYAPGDTVWVQRSEIYNNWALDYLGVTLWKKIDYYKFRSTNEMHAAIGKDINGIAFPFDCALATIYSWQNHECFHIYNSLYSDVPTIRLYEEGMVVAHEIDPYNSNYASQWNRRELEEPYIYHKKVREFLADGLLYPIGEILESHAFNEAFRQSGMVLYVEAGMFVKYLITTFGLDKMKEVFCSVGYSDSKETIMTKFQEVFGVDIIDVEAEWLAYLEETS